MKNSTVLSLVWLFAVSSIGFAFSGNGSGIQADPYIITDVYQLQEMKNEVGAYYVLGNDIDASDTINWNSGAGFEPVGKLGNEFVGVFDGRGFVISNLYINRPSTVYIGLFGFAGLAHLNSATPVIKNVGLANAQVTGRGDTGALVGISWYSQISYCWSTGKITGTDADQTSIGGLLGFTAGIGAVVQNCYSMADVQAIGTGSLANRSGGFSGGNYFGSIIRDCFAMGNVSAKTKSGGFVGDNTHGSDGGYISRCYSTGKVIGSGGLVGYNYLSGKTYDSYWDINTSGKTSGYGGVGKSTIQMMQQATFVGWDFNNVWGIDEGSSYPFLLAFYEKPNIVNIEIAGPNEVAEDTETQYKAIAHYDDGSNEDITKEANWFVEGSDFADIDANGLFGCDQVFTFDTVCTVHAEIKDSNEVFVAQKRVKIIPMCSSGSAAQLDGVNDYVNMGSSPAFNTEKLTLSFWAKLNKPNGQFQGGVVKGWAFGNQYEYSYQLVFHEGIARAGVVTMTSAAQVNAPILDDKWHNWVLTFGDGRISIYRDSVLVETKPFVGQIDYSQSHNNFIVGARDNRQYSIDGLIDDVSIFNRALSADEILYNMNNKLSGGEAGLVGCWDFDEGEGQIAHDKSGKGNHGILGGTENIETSDPTWFSMGRPCTRPELIKRNLETAKQVKADILDDLDYALQAENASQKMLLDMQREKDYSLWRLVDIVRARVYTQIAVLKESVAKDKIQSSNQDLSNALKTLEKPVEKSKESRKK
jgi:hypothetical protein